MKLTSILVTLASLVFLVGCETPTPTLVSLDAVVSNEDSKGDSALTGAWEDPDDKSNVFVIRASEHAGYNIAVYGDMAPVGFHARIFRVGGAELLDLEPVDNNDFRIPGHALVRIWTGSILRWALLDSDWFKKQAAQLATRTSGERVLVLSPGSAPCAHSSRRPSRTETSRLKTSTPMAK